MKPVASALVIGAAGQDGSYMTELLLEKGYHVAGVVRRGQAARIPSLEAVRNRIDLIQADLLDAKAIENAVASYRPTEVYNFASVSFGPDAWADPVRTTELGSIAVAQLLEIVRRADSSPRFFQASSAWVFGQPTESPQTESTRYAPVEPYGAAKAFGDFLVRGYRERHDLFACSAIYYNHESPRRPDRFVTRKITKAAASIRAGFSTDLELGDLDARRDWGYAADYVKAAWLMLQAEEPADYVIATGETHTVRELVDLAFTTVGLEWEGYVNVNAALRRPKGQVANLVGDSSAARSGLGWTTTVSFEELVKLMVDADLADVAAQTR